MKSHSFSGMPPKGHTAHGFQETGPIRLIAAKAVMRKVSNNLNWVRNAMDEDITVWCFNRLIQRVKMKTPDSQAQRGQMTQMLPML